MGKPTAASAGPMLDTNIIIRFRSDEKKDLMQRLSMCDMELSDYIRKLIELDKREGYICRY